MPYTAWSVIFGEQPSAAKWNQLGTNDAGFRDGSNFALENPIQAATGEHIEFTPGTSKFVKTSVLRQDGGSGGVVNAYKNNSVILSGYGYITGTNADRNSKAVTFGVTFDSANNLIVVLGAFSELGSAPATIGALNGGVSNKIFHVFADAVTTTGFSAVMEQRSTGSANGVFIGFSWIAIGILA